MSHFTIILSSLTKRQLAASYCLNAPENTTVDFRENKRSVPQNDKFHAMCGDVAKQIIWKDMFGRPLKMSQESWKRFFLRIYQSEALVVPNEEGTAFFDLGVSSSKLVKKDFMDLIEIVYAFGSRKGVKFKDEPEAPAHERGVGA
jgi:hypothetical protein